MINVYLFISSKKETKRIWFLAPFHSHSCTIQKGNSNEDSFKLKLVMVCVEYTRAFLFYIKGRDLLLGRVNFIIIDFSFAFILMLSFPFSLLQKIFKEI